MRLTVIHIKTVHTAIFAVLSGCVIYVLVSGAFNHITGWIWVAVAAIVVEGLVLAVSGGKCPLTVLASDVALWTEVCLISFSRSGLPIAFFPSAPHCSS